MSKYYLKIYFENGSSEVITKGSLEQVDNFIIENNIYHSDDLYEYCVSKLSRCIEGKIGFKIEYKYNEEIKEKSLFFKPTLNRFRNNNNIACELHELIVKDSNFKKEFFKKYFKEILESDKELPILKHVSKYLKEPNQKTFDRFYYSYITAKKEVYPGLNTTSIEARSAKRPMYIESGENEVQIKYSYTKKRNMFEFLDIYKYGKYNHYILIEKTDEFDELLLHDQNPDTGLRGVFSDEIEQTVLEIKDNGVKKLKKTPKIDEKQISVFDIL